MTIQLDLESLTPWLWAAGVLLYLAVGVLVVRVADRFECDTGPLGTSDAFLNGFGALIWPVIVVIATLVGAVYLLGWLATGRKRKG